MDEFVEGNIIVNSYIRCPGRTSLEISREELSDAAENREINQREEFSERFLVTVLQLKNTKEE